MSEKMVKIEFNCHGNSSPAYSCNKPGDNSGVYVQATDAKELLAENARLREKVKQLEADVAHHNQGWDRCVVENNGLREQVENITLQRDVLALNRDGRDSQVIVVMDGNKVACVAWPKSQSASMPLVRMPPQTTEGE